MKPLELRIAGVFFTFRPLPTLLTAGMLGLLMALGTWQIERLHWKENLLLMIDQRRHQPPVSVFSITDPQNSEYRPVEAIGVLEHNKELYLTSISLTGEGGYHVVTPLRLKDGSVLMVDRGWVPYAKKLPATRPGGQLNGPVVITGILRLPHPRWLQGAARPDQKEWPAIDLAAMAKAEGFDALLPFFVEVDAAANGSGGYPIGGQTRMTMPNDHLAYAITWFGLALALLVIYGASARRHVS
jgi:surfeit locus 1 family protein